MRLRIKNIWWLIMNVNKEENYILIGFFNSNNIGDVILSECLYRQISKNNKISIIPFEGGLCYKRNSLYYKSRIIRLLNHVIPNWAYWYVIKRKIKSSNGLILGGGNMLMSIPTYSTIEKYDKLVNLALKQDKKVYSLLIGAGPFVSIEDTEKAKKILKSCERVLFRDSLSNKTLDSSYSVSYDPAFLLDTNSGYKKEKYILLNVINPDTFCSGLYNEYYNFYSFLYQELVKIGLKVIVLVSEKRDLIIAKALRAENPQLIIEYPDTVSRFIDIICRADFIFGTRMHSMIVSFTQLVPIIGFCWQDKVKGFFDTIDCNQNLFYPKIDQIPYIINRFYEIEKNIGDYKKDNITKLDYIRKRITTDLDDVL